MSESNFIQFKSYKDSQSPLTHQSSDVWVRKDTIEMASAYSYSPDDHTILYLNNGKKIVVEGDVKAILHQIESVD